MGVGQAGTPLGPCRGGDEDSRVGWVWPSWDRAVAGLTITERG